VGSNFVSKFHVGTKCLYSVKCSLWINYSFALRLFVLECSSVNLCAIYCFSESFIIIHNLHSLHDSQRPPARPPEAGAVMSQKTEFIHSQKHPMDIVDCQKGEGRR
jgi:hypothetical protein